MKEKKGIVIPVAISIIINVISCILICFAFKNPSVSSYFILINMILSIIVSMYVFLKGNKYLQDKKDYEIMFVAFLLLMFTFLSMTLASVAGYKSVAYSTGYVSYMEYTSTLFNLLIYLIFILIIGIFNLNLYIKSKIINLK